MSIDIVLMRNMELLGFRSLQDGNILGILWMLISCQFVGKRVLEQVLITFVRRMASGKRPTYIFRQ